jgi:long-subunit acyl-CoA synthetase (AMP-forming)
MTIIHCYFLHVALYYMLCHVLQLITGYGLTEYGIYTLLILTYRPLLHVQLITGYGLTETSPTILQRTVDTNVFGSVGYPLSGTQVPVAL